MSAPPFIQLFPADYLKDTGRLSTLQHGAYFLLIMDYWVNGGLPDDDDQLAAIARLTPEQWVKNRAVLERYFAPGWVHGRIERDLAKAQEKNTRRVSAGKAGAIARHAQGNRTSNANNPSIATNNASSNDDGNALASSSDSHKEVDTSLRSVSAAKPRKPKSVKSAIAEDAQPTQTDRDHAAKVGMLPDVFRFQWVKFRDHHLKKGDRFASWPAAWRTWCAGWIERGGANQSRAGPFPRRSGPSMAEMSRMDETDLGDDEPAAYTDHRSQAAQPSDESRSGPVGLLPFEDHAHGADRRQPFRRVVNC